MPCRVRNILETPKRFIEKPLAFLASQISRFARLTISEPQRFRKEKLLLFYVLTKGWGKKAFFQNRVPCRVRGPQSYALLGACEKRFAGKNFLFPRLLRSSAKDFFLSHPAKLQLCWAFQNQRFCQEAFLPKAISQSFLQWQKGFSLERKAC